MIDTMTQLSVMTQNQTAGKSSQKCSPVGAGSAVYLWWSGKKSSTKKDPPHSAMSDWQVNIPSPFIPVWKTKVVPTKAISTLQSTIFFLYRSEPLPLSTPLVIFIYSINPLPLSLPYNKEHAISDYIYKWFFVSLYKYMFFWKSCTSFLFNMDIEHYNNI